MTHGPAIQAGHTMGRDEHVDFHFAEVPQDLKLPFEHDDMLLLTRQAKKRKKFLGLF